MLGNRGNIESTGLNSVNNTGNGNHFNIQNHLSAARILNRTYLYDFCEKFSMVDDGSDGYNTNITSGINDKIAYNEISLYKDIFKECDHYYEDVESILEEIPKRQRILTNINIQYRRLKELDEWNSKDELCDKVYQYLIQTIENDQNSGNIVVEDVELAIHSLMYYTFVKCKLLDPLPQNLNR
ncbi:ABC-three component system protein [Paenibacillus azoreducens]|uniref:ABC-three component system protein n=1 Tax=Paenibacillus azoreducens TaxID=116718 RepID=UPI0039F605AD